MAEDAQVSGPLPLQKFTRDLWTKHFGRRQGIEGDTDGSAFGITLPAGSDVAEIGSPTVESVALINGFPVVVPQGTTQSVPIPPSLTGGANGRTDLVVARYSTTFNTAPGPGRLHVIGGTEGSLAVPTYNPRTDLRLWSVRRRQGEGLNQAIVADLRSWVGASILVAPGAPLPISAPLGTRATRDGSVWRRDRDGSSVQWVLEYEPPEIITNPLTATMDVADGWSRMANTSLERDGRWRIGTFTVRRTGAAIESNSRGGLGDIAIVQLHPSDRPIPGTPIPAYAPATNNGTTQAGVHVSGAWISLDSLPPNTEISNPGVGNASLIISGVWKVS
jgi:hypothetical protein